MNAFLISGWLLNLCGLILLLKLIDGINIETQRKNKHPMVSLIAIMLMPFLMFLIFWFVLHISAEYEFDRERINNRQISPLISF
ncbi:hypothetical protein [Campylobacter sp. RM16187]|uniref:hypothetical protein n=1 Tax=Campylobacter sp. RM16187 TaxID=1660063 RepID=UPI0021B67963|nr:hypothetical protein [Campylobacter sp. RM16187]QKG29742.1 putative membrane protein [Campylobacter sp. RM16187]